MKVLQTSQTPEGEKTRVLLEQHNVDAWVVDWLHTIRPDEDDDARVQHVAVLWSDRTHVKWELVGDDWVDDWWYPEDDGKVT